MWPVSVSWIWNLQLNLKLSRLVVTGDTSEIWGQHIPYLGIIFRNVLKQVAGLPLLSRGQKALSWNRDYAWESESESCSLVYDSLQPHGLYSPWNSPGQNTGVAAFPFSRDLLNPGIKPRSAALQADSLPAEPLGKPKNTGVGSLSLLHRIFPTQELNQGHLYCRWILYQLNNQGSLNREYSTSITCYLILLFQLVKCWCVCVEKEESEWKYAKLY